MPDIIKDASMQQWIAVFLAFATSVASWMHADNAKDIAQHANLSTTEVREIYSQRGRVDAEILSMSTALTDLQQHIHREQERRDSQLKERAELNKVKYDDLRSDMSAMLKFQEHAATRMEERIGKIGGLLVDIFNKVNFSSGKDK